MINITVCVGGSCHYKGAFQVIQELERLILEHGLTDQVALIASACLQDCSSGVCVNIDTCHCTGVTPQNVGELFSQQVLSAFPK